MNSDTADRSEPLWKDFVERLRRRPPAASDRRPFVTVSYAQSVDGSIAGRNRLPIRLSGPAAMRLTHRLRAVHDAILVGIETVLADDPRLTVRLVAGPNPRPIVLDTQLRTPPGCRHFVRNCRLSPASHGGHAIWCPGTAPAEI